MKPCVSWADSGLAAAKASRGSASSAMREGGLPETEASKTRAIKID
jgi:hypothetical protein